MPKVSVIIISYNMSREIPRTVESFLPPYQQRLASEDVEILVMENGSTQPISNFTRDRWPSNVKYIEVPDAQSSPARALNLGANIARAPVVCPVIDGARMASPGLLATGLQALNMFERTFAASVGFHLGHKLQQQAIKEGYNRDLEDALLRDIRWPTDGYRLFEIAAPGGSSQYTWFGALAESNAPLLRKSLYEELGGYDEAFDLPGGGLVNLDFLSRALELDDLEYVLLLGEATFHQIHGGVTTSADIGKTDGSGSSIWDTYVRQYKDIRAKNYSKPIRKPILFGKFPEKAANIAQKGLTHLINHSSK